MIDCLSSPEWIKPQIDFLLFLQNFRVGYLESFDKFFLSITIFGELWLPTLVCAVVYWCVDCRAGIYLFSLHGINTIVTHLFKMIACVYRPWVLDGRLHPSELALPFAKGYSFPSGHSSMSSSVFGGVAYLLRKKKILCALFIFLVLLIGFSRLWLGVHTPQDVICGLSIGFILVLLMNPIIDWAEKNPNRYLYLLGAINIFAVSAYIYMQFFNTYRIDYIDGKILADPQSQKYIAFVLYAFALGIINGCFLCRRFFPFNPKDVPVKQRVIRGVIGIALVFCLTQLVFQNIILNTVTLKFALPVLFLAGMFVTLFYPIIFIKLKKI